MSNISSSTGVASADADYSHLTTHAIGASYCLFASISLVLNVVVLVAIRRCGLLRGEVNNDSSNTVFILAGLAMFDCLVRLTIVVGYLGPIILFQQRLGGNTVCYHISQLLLISWTVGSTTEMLIALNRLLAIKSACGSRWAGRAMAVLFTRRNCLLFIIGIYPMQYGIHYALLALTPCCKPIFSYQYFTIMFDEAAAATENVFFDTIIRPVAALCTAIPFLCYVAIFVIILRHSRNSIVQHLDESSRAERRKEAFSCLQFALAYFFYFGLWVTVELQVYLPREHPYLFSMVTYSSILDMSTTALIQATMNSAVRAELARMLKCLGGGRIAPAQMPTLAGSSLRVVQ